MVHKLDWPGLASIIMVMDACVTLGKHSHKWIFSDMCGILFYFSKKRDVIQTCNFSPFLLRVLDFFKFRFLHSFSFILCHFFPFHPSAKFTLTVCCQNASGADLNSNSTLLIEKFRYSIMWNSSSQMYYLSASLTLSNVFLHGNQFPWNFTAAFGFGIFFSSILLRFDWTGPSRAS